MVLPTTKLGYTLGIKRDRDIISPRERQKASPFKGRRTRMAGEKLLDIYSVREGEAPSVYTTGDQLPDRLKADKGLGLSDQFTQTLGIPIEIEEDD
jgi:hypothetical protein